MQTNLSSSTNSKAKKNNMRTNLSNYTNSKAHNMRTDGQTDGRMDGKTTLKTYVPREGPTTCGQICPLARIQKQKTTCGQICLLARIRKQTTCGQICLLARIQKQTICGQISLKTFLFNPLQRKFEDCPRVINKGNNNVRLTSI